MNAPSRALIASLLILGAQPAGAGDTVLGRSCDLARVGASDKQALLAFGLMAAASTVADPLGDLDGVQPLLQSFAPSACLEQTSCSRPSRHTLIGQHHHDERDMLEA